MKINSVNNYNSQNPQKKQLNTNTKQEVVKWKHLLIQKLNRHTKIIFTLSESNRKKS